MKNNLINKDCIEVMKDMEDNSIHLIDSSNFMLYSDTPYRDMSKVGKDFIGFEIVKNK